jgi:hypothetical protein
VRRLHSLLGKLWPAFLGTQGVLVIEFLTEQCTINAAYYPKLLKGRVKPAFRSKRRDRSVKSFCLLHDDARPHTAAVKTGTLEEVHREGLPHHAFSPDLAPSDFHLLGPIKEALRGERFGADCKLNFSCNSGWTSYKKKTF